MSFHNHDEPGEIRKRYPGMTFAKFSAEVNENITPKMGVNEMNSLYEIYKTITVNFNTVREFLKFQFADNDTPYSVIKIKKK